MPSLKQDPPAITLTHLTIMVGYFWPQAVGLAEAVLARQSPGSRPHLMSKTGFAVGAAAVDKPTLLAARAAEVSAWRCRGWEREWEHVSAPKCSCLLQAAPRRAPAAPGEAGVTGPVP